MRAVLALLLLICGTAAFAETSATQQGFKGNDMLQPCGVAEQVMTGQLSESAAATRADVLMMGICLGAIDALHFLSKEATKDSQIAICVPDTVKGPQLIVVVSQYLRNNPQRLDQRFTYLAMEALFRAWPCKK